MIPCRINHGSIKNKIQWNSNVDINKISFDPLLIYFFKGLKEDKHPFNFISTEGIKELLESLNSCKRATPLLKDIMGIVRESLIMNNDIIFNNALTALKLLSNCVKDNLDPYISSIITQINKKSNTKFKPIINSLLATLEENGGENISKIIKSKIVTYNSIK